MVEKMVHDMKHPDEVKGYVVVVGVGALGSHVVQFLRNIEPEIRIIDFDRVESKNVASQFHARNSIGNNKTHALKKMARFLWGRDIRANPHRLTEHNVSELLGGAALVIDCLDNAESRLVVRNYCYDIPASGLADREPIPCLHGALDAAGSFGRVVWSESFRIDDEDVEGAATCEDGEFLPFIAITAAFIARAAQAYLEHGKREGWSIHPGGAIPT